MINVSWNIQYGTFADVLARCPNDGSYFGEGTVGGKSEKARGRRNDDKTIKKDLKNGQAAREFRPTKKDDAIKKIKGQKNAVDSNARPRTRGPCSPGHSGPQTPRNTFLRSLSENLKFLFYSDRQVYQYRHDHIGFTIDRENFYNRYHYSGHAR